MLLSGLLKPIAVAGNPSVTRFTQSSWTYKVMKKRHKHDSHPYKKLERSAE
jgi:hypothetical protein